MKRFLKHLVCILALAVACVGCGALVGCGGDKADGLTVIVQYADGTAVDGTATQMTAQVCKADADGNTGACLADTPAVGKDGKATFPQSVFDELDEEMPQFHVQLNNTPAGYSYDESKTYVSKAGTLTIVLTKDA